MLTMSSQHEISSEIAYDLFQDHMDVVLSLLNQPLSKEEVIAQVGSELIVDRLLKHGLITIEGNTVNAVAGIYHQLRKEGMMSFLERYVLPSINANVVEGEGSGIGILSNLFLELPADVLQGLRKGPVDELINKQLADISDRPTDGSVYRLTVLVVGTSLPTEEDLFKVGDDTVALENLRCSALQRANPAEKDQAVMIQFDCLADKGRYFAAAEAAESFINLFKPYKAVTAEGSSAVTNYRLTVATHWQCSNANDVETFGSRQLC